MAIVVFQHHKNETASILGETLADHGHKLRVVRLFAGNAVPVDLDDVDGVISMGGPMNVSEVEQNPWIPAEIAYLKAAHDAGKPVVGVCLGAQLIAAALGGKVAPLALPGPPPPKPGDPAPTQPPPPPTLVQEVGWHNVKLTFQGQTETIYQGIPWDTMQFHSHGQEVSALPPGAVPLAGSKLCKTQAFKVGYRTYGFQYHFEWNKADLEVAARDPFVAQSGGDVEQIIKDIEPNYENYRRTGNRLCDTMAKMLFPIDKRLVR